MKKIIFLILLIGVSNTVKSNENLNFQCIQDNNNFIIFYPFEGYWAIVTDKPLKAAKRATGITTGSTTQITAAVVQNTPKNTNKYIWANGAVENNLTAYIEPLCYAL